MFNNLNFASNDTFLGSNAEVKSVGLNFDYSMFYRAIVKSNYDPEGLGRIRICIPALHSSLVDTNQYPWAYPGCMVGFGNQVGQFILPPEGSVVFVAFEYSNEHRPIYFGGIPTKFAEGKRQAYGPRVNDGQYKEITNDDIPTEYTGSQAIIYKSPEGAIIYVDDYTYGRKVVIKDAAGQEIVQKSWTSQSGVEHTSTSLIVDKSNKVVIAPDKLTLTISGVSKTLTKETLLKIGQENESDDELIVWD